MAPDSYPVVKYEFFFCQGKMEQEWQKELWEKRRVLLTSIPFAPLFFLFFSLIFLIKATGYESHITHPISSSKHNTHLQIKMLISIPKFQTNSPKAVPFGAAHKYIPHVRGWGVQSRFLSFLRLPN